MHGISTKLFQTHRGGLDGRDRGPRYSKLVPGGVTPNSTPTPQRIASGERSLTMSLWSVEAIYTTKPKSEETTPIAS